MNSKFKLIFSLIIFLVLFFIYNHNSKWTDFFKTNKELFLEHYLPLEMNNEKYLGIISDSSNHMNPYLRFSKTCLPLLNSWENTFEKGDIVSKLKKSTDLILLRDNKTNIIKLDTINFEGSPFPCECSKILK